MYKNTYSSLVLNSPKQKQPECLLTSEWINKLWSTGTKSFSTYQDNTDVKNTMLSKIQVLKNTYDVISFIWNSRTWKINLCPGTQWWSLGWGDWNKAWRNCLDSGNILYLDLGGGHLCVFNYHNLSSCLRSIHSIVYKF